MTRYTLSPVRHVGLTLEPCEESERELYAIYSDAGEHAWLADFSPHALETAQSIVAWLNRREMFKEELDKYDLKADNDERG